MEQKTRDRAALAVTLLLVPVLVYLLVKNAPMLDRRKRAAARAQVEVQEPSPSPQRAVMAGILQNLEIVTAPARPALDPRVLEEQKRISSLLPKRSPFFVKKVIKPVETPTAPVEAVPEKAQKLNLTIIYAVGEKRTAVINGKFLDEGQEIDGWKIIKISADDVIIENGQEKKTLRVGRK